MAAQPQLLSLEEFHRLYDGAKPAYEYWSGAAIRKSIPTILHGILQSVIMMLLEGAGWNTASEVRLKVSSEAEPVPDVVAVCGKYKGRYPSSAPALCVEILSPDDTLPKAFKKAAVYISWGAERVWIIDPEKRTAWSLASETGSEPVWIPPTGDLLIGDTRISLPSLFSEVDRKFEAESAS